MRLVLLDMDGTVLMGRSLRALAQAFDLEEELAALDREKQQRGLSEREVAHRIAGLFAGLSLRDLYRVFDLIPLTPGACPWIRDQQRRGRAVALVSDSWRPLVERLAARLGVDEVWANGLEVESGQLTGVLLPPPCPADLPPDCQRHAVCKLHALRSLAEKYGVEPGEILAVGDGPVDVCMLREAGLGVALNPKTHEVAQAADIVVFGDFYDLARAVEAKEARDAQGSGSRIIS